MIKKVLDEEERGKRRKEGRKGKRDEEERRNEKELHELFRRRQVSTST